MQPHPGASGSFRHPKNKKSYCDVTERLKITDAFGNSQMALRWFPEMLHARVGEWKQNNFLNKFVTSTQVYEGVHLVKMPVSSSNLSKRMVHPLSTSRILSTLSMMDNRVLRRLFLYVVQSRALKVETVQ
jgi:hypothetical protein